MGTHSWKPFDENLQKVAAILIPMVERGCLNPEEMVDLFDPEKKPENTLMDVIEMAGISDKSEKDKLFWSFEGYFPWALHDGSNKRPFPSEPELAAINELVMKYPKGFARHIYEHEYDVSLPTAIINGLEITWPVYLRLKLASQRFFHTD